MKGKPAPWSFRETHTVTSKFQHGKRTNGVNILPLRVGDTDFLQACEVKVALLKTTGGILKLFRH